jgi:hypothetical protein
MIAIRAIGVVETSEQADTDPVRRFIEHLVSAIGTGRAHVAASGGGAPPQPAGWGWRREMVAGDFEQPWRAQGPRIGWLDDQDLYLDPTASYSIVRTVGEAVGEPIELTSLTLHKRMHSAGLLASTDEGRDRLRVRRAIEGRRRPVLHLKAASLAEPAQPAQQAHANRTGRADGPDGWAGSHQSPEATGPATGAEPAHAERADSPYGPLGPLGPLGPVHAPRDTEPLLEPRIDAGASDNEVIELVRRLHLGGQLGGQPIQLASGIRVVDPHLAASNWLKDLDRDGWMGNVARVHLLRLGRAILSGQADA